MKNFPRLISFGLFWIITLQHTSKEIQEYLNTILGCFEFVFTSKYGLLLNIMNKNLYPLFEMGVGDFNDMNLSDVLLLNISSGTPAMKSGLLVLQTIGKYPCKTIQVATPERKMNEHIHEGYDVKTLWELNEDNTEKFENRCKEVICPPLNLVHKEGIIKKHLEVYDCAAALAVAETLPRIYREKYEDLIHLGYYRMLFNFKEADKLEISNGLISTMEQ